LVCLGGFGPVGSVLCGVCVGPGGPGPRVRSMMHSPGYLGSGVICASINDLAGYAQYQNHVRKLIGQTISHLFGSHVANA